MIEIGNREKPKFSSSMAKLRFSTALPTSCARSRRCFPSAWDAGCSTVKTADASWEDVVSFLKNNSMFLSHGYCPDCEKKLLE